MVAHLSDTSLLGQHLMGVVNLQQQVSHAQTQHAQVQRAQDGNGWGDEEDEEEEKKDDTEGRGSKRRRDQRSASPPNTGSVPANRASSRV